MEHSRPSDEDQEPWVPPGGRGLVSAPLFPDDEAQPPEPERPGADRESRRLRQAVVFAVILLLLAGTFVAQLGWRLAR